MGNVERILLLVAVILMGGGGLLYDFGSRLNRVVGDYDRMLWEQAPGDKWLYAGGLMMLISGALAVAALRFWWNTRREERAGRCFGGGRLHQR